MEVSQEELVNLRSYLCDFDFDSVRMVYRFIDDEDGPQMLLLTWLDEVYAYGSNPYGILATGDDKPIQDKPKRIDRLCGKKIIDFASGYRFVMALTECGDVYTWGLNDCGQLGAGSKIPFRCWPEKVDFRVEDRKMKAIACGRKTAYALTDGEDSTIFSWGCNSHGQLGIGTNEGTSPIPMRVVTHILGHDDRIIKIHAHGTIAYAQTSEGHFLFWGKTDHYGDSQATEYNCLHHRRSSNWGPIIYYTSPPPNRPRAFSFESPFPVKDSCSGDGICAALTVDGSIYLWQTVYGVYGRRPYLAEGLNGQGLALTTFGSDVALIATDKRIYVFSPNFDQYEPLLLKGTNLLETMLSNDNFCVKLCVVYPKDEIYRVPMDDNSKLYVQGHPCDVFFEFREDMESEEAPCEIKTVEAHRWILARNSDKFKTQFSGDWADSLQPVIHIPDRNYQVFQTYIVFLYSGGLNLKPLSLVQLIDLYDLGIEYCDLHVPRFCLQSIKLRSQIENSESFESLVEAFKLSSLHPELHNVFAMALSMRLALDNFIEMAKFALRYKSENLLLRIGRFIKENGQQALDIISNEEIQLQRDLLMASMQISAADSDLKCQRTIPMQQSSIIEKVNDDLESPAKRLKIF